MIRFTRLAFLFAALVISTRSASAAIVTTEPDVIPMDNPYVAAKQTLNKATPKLFETVVKGKAVNSRVADGPNAELIDFDLTMEVLLQYPGPTSVPATLTGSAVARSVNLTGTLVGDYQTELLSLQLTGSTSEGPISLRENPSLASLGGTKISDLGGGLFQVDSFFDVFFEVSLDSGNSWEPYSSAGNFNLVPEPSTLGLACASALFLAPLAWRRRRRSPHRVEVD